jgi:hypothetical protein
MEGHCSTGQSPQRAVAATEEKEERGIDHTAHKSIFLFCRRLMHVMGRTLIYEPSQCILQRENHVISGYSISYRIS